MAHPELQVVVGTPGPLMTGPRTSGGCPGIRVGRPLPNDVRSLQSKPDDHRHCRANGQEESRSSTSVLMAPLRP